MGVFYCTREQFMSAGVITPSSQANRTVDRLLESKSRQIEESLGRSFFPYLQTRYYDFPTQFGQSTYRLYLNGDLLEVVTLTIGGEVVASGYFLEPVNYATGYDGAQDSYSRLEMDLSGSSSFSSGETTQRSIAIAGLWGYSNKSAPAGTLAVALSDTTGVTVILSDSAVAGVGDLIKIDSERMIITEKRLRDTGANLNGGLDSEDSDTLVTLDDATLVHEGEIITVDAEKMYIDSIAGNDCIVERAVQGSVLAAHSTAVSVYAPRTATVERGAAGTTAATHLVSTAITRNVPPQLITDLCIAEAASTFYQEKAGYARTVGSGDGVMQVTGRGLADVRKAAEVYRRGRTVRTV